MNSNHSNHSLSFITCILCKKLNWAVILIYIGILFVIYIIVRYPIISNSEMISIKFSIKKTSVYSNQKQFLFNNIRNI